MIKRKLYDRYDYDLDVFYRENALSWYLLGCYMTDGHIGVVNGKPIFVTLTSKDIGWLRTIRNLICPGKRLVPHDSCKTFTIHSTELVRWFIAKGCTPTKSLTLQWPTVPEQYLPDFIRGCIDGDGSILFRYKHKSSSNSRQVTCALYSASKSFVMGFQSALEKKGIPYSVDCRKDIGSTQGIINGRAVIRRSPFYGIRVSGEFAHRFIKWIYYLGYPLAMPRKERTARKITKHFAKCKHVKFRGTCWIKRECKWRSTLQHNGHTYYLGSYDSAIEAAKAYDAKAKALLGTRAITNF